MDHSHHEIGEPSFSKTKNLQMLVYTSSYAGDQENCIAVIDEIIRTAVPQNRNRQVSGMLYFHKNRFIQVLEGQPADLQETMGLIRSARSHKDIELVSEDPIEERSFALWNMGQLNFSNCQDVDPTFFKKVVELYKTILMPRADRLIETYQLLVRDKEFANLI